MNWKTITVAVAIAAFFTASIAPATDTPGGANSVCREDYRDRTIPPNYFCDNTWPFSDTCPTREGYIVQHVIGDFVVMGWRSCLKTIQVKHFYLHLFSEESSEVGFYGYVDGEWAYLGATEAIASRKGRIAFHYTGGCMCHSYTVNGLGHEFRDMEVNGACPCGTGPGAGGSGNPSEGPGAGPDEIEP